MVQTEKSSGDFEFFYLQYRKLDIFAKHKIPPTLLSEVVESAKDWATSNGLVMKFKDNPTLSKHAPFVLFPSPFPTYLYNEAFQVQKDFQTLFHRASLDHEFIKDSLKRYFDCCVFVLL